MLAIGIEVRCMHLVLYVWPRGEADACRASSRRFESVHVLFGESGSAATAVASKTTMRRFESCLSCLFRSIAQLAERRTLNAEVPGSSPGRPAGDVAELANAPVCYTGSRKAVQDRDLPSPLSLVLRSFETDDDCRANLAPWSVCERNDVISRAGQ